MTAWSLRRVRELDEAQIDGLADVLIDCVEGGASVSFMHPLSRDRARAFWRGVAQAVASGERALLLAEDARGPCGTVQLVLAQPENQPHRAGKGSEPHCFGRPKPRRESAKRRCWCSTPQATTPSACMRAWAGSVSV